MAKFNIGDRVKFVDPIYGNETHIVTGKSLHYGCWGGVFVSYYLANGKVYPEQLLQLATPPLEFKRIEFKRMKFLLSRDCDKLQNTCKYLDSIGFDVSNVNCLPSYIETRSDGTVKVGHSLAEFAVSTAVLAYVTNEFVCNYTLNIGSQPSLIEFNNKLYDEDKLNKLLSEAEYNPN